MKILIVSNGFPPSGQWGTEFYTHQLATGLLGRGHDVTVLCPERSGSRPRYTVDESERYGVRLLELHNAGDPSKRFEDSYVNTSIEELFDRLIREERPDLVHFTHFLWGLSVRLPQIARARGVKVLATLTDFGLLCHRGQLFDWSIKDCGGPHDAETCARCIREPGPFDGGALSLFARRWAARGLAAVGGAGVVVTAADVEKRAAAVRLALNAIDLCIAPTRALGDVFRASGVPNERIFQLCYAIDEIPFRDAALTTDPAQYRFGFLGQFMPHKGLHFLFEAVRQLQASLPASAPDWEVRLHGNTVGGRHARYLDAIWASDLTEHVRFLGPFEPLRGPSVMASLDAVLLPSQWMENAPLTTIQARAAGVPMIAADVAGMREVLATSLEAGDKLVPPDDPAQLADAMRGFLLERPARRAGSRPPISYLEHLDRIETVYARLTGLEGTPQLVPASRSLTARAVVRS